MQSNDKHISLQEHFAYATEILMVHTGEWSARISNLPESPELITCLDFLELDALLLPNLHTTISCHPSYRKEVIQHTTEVWRRPVALQPATNPNKSGEGHDLELQG